MDEGVRTKLLDAMKWEDAKLSGFIEKNRLDEWYLSTLETAKSTVSYHLNDSSDVNANDDRARDGNGVDKRAVE